MGTRLQDMQTRRAVLKTGLLGGAAAALFPMRALAAQPVTTGRNILTPTSRVPCVLAMDDLGNFVYGRLTYDRATYSRAAAGIDPDTQDLDFIAAQYQFTASTAKVIAHLAIADWIREQAALGPRADDVSPADELLHDGLQDYAFVLGRKASAMPRLQPGGVMFIGGTFNRNSDIHDLTYDEMLRIGALISANDVYEYFNRAMGGQLAHRMAMVAARLGMDHSEFPTVHGMPGVDARGQRADCRSNAAGMLHAARVLDTEYQEFAPYFQQLSYLPTRLAAHLGNLRDGAIRPQVQYIEGPGGASVSIDGGEAPDAFIDSETGRDLNAAYNPANPEGTAAAPATDDDDDDNAPIAEEENGPQGGYEGVRLMKTGQIGVEKVWSRRRRRFVMLRSSRRTSWRTTLGVAEQIIDGVPRKLYIWTSGDSAAHRQANLREVLSEGFAALRRQPVVQQALSPEIPQQAAGLQPKAERLDF